MTRTLVRALATSVVLTVLALLGIGAANVSAQVGAAADSTLDPTQLPVTGTLADGTGSVSGIFDVERFVDQDGTIQAVGSFTGTVTDAAGNATSGSQQVTMPVDTAQIQASCEILDLVLGPLDLNLLGLEVHLDTVHLNITAQSGPGNLLGNLLCAIAGLLDGPLDRGVLGQIVLLLNQILSLLG